MGRGNVRCLQIRLSLIASIDLTHRPLSDSTNSQIRTCQQGSIFDKKCMPWWNVEENRLPDGAFRDTLFFINGVQRVDGGHKASSWQINASVNAAIVLDVLFLFYFLTFLLRSVDPNCGTTKDVLRGASTWGKRSKNRVLQARVTEWRRESQGRVSRGCWQSSCMGFTSTAQGDQKPVQTSWNKIASGCIHRSWPRKHWKRCCERLSFWILLQASSCGNMLKYGVDMNGQ